MTPRPRRPLRAGREAGESLQIGYESLANCPKQQAYPLITYMCFFRKGKTALQKEETESRREEKKIRKEEAGFQKEEPSFREEETSHMQGVENVAGATRFLTATNKKAAP